MLFIPLKKASLLIPSSQKDDNHLFVIITNPCKEGKVLIINFSTIRSDKHDPACVVNKGDHVFIKHPSYVVYRYSKIVSANELSKKVKSGEFIQHQPITDQLLARIQDGISSSFANLEIKKYFYENCDN